MLTTPTQTQIARLELDKLRRQLEERQEELRQSLADRELLVVRAPADGVVYYGAAVRGKWTQVAAMRAKLRQGGSIGHDEIFMTVVRPRPLHVLAGAQEEDLHHLRPGLAAVVKATGFPGERFAARVAEIASVPQEDGTFAAQLAIRGEPAQRLMPGMTCSASIEAYSAASALSVPASAVIEDDGDLEKHYVYLLRGDGQREKRYVTVGVSDGEKVEILSGLSAGDRVAVDAQDAAES